METIRSLEMKVEELQKIVKDRESETKSALEEKDSQIKNMARDLDEIRTERDAMEMRLKQVESSSLMLTNENERLQKQFTEKKEAMETSTKSVGARLTSLADASAKQKEETIQMTEKNLKLEKLVETQQTMLSTLADRLSASEQQIERLQSSLYQQNQTAIQERQRTKMQFESVASIIVAKDSRIHELEVYIQQAAKDAKQLKSLLYQLNRTFGGPEMPAKKRKTEDTDNSNREPPQSRRKVNKNNES